MYHEIGHMVGYSPLISGVNRVKPFGAVMCYIWLLITVRLAAFVCYLHLVFCLAFQRSSLEYDHQNLTGSKSKKPINNWHY